MRLTPKFGYSIRLVYVTHQIDHFRNTLEPAHGAMICYAGPFTAARFELSQKGKQIIQNVFSSRIHISCLQKTDPFSPVYYRQ